MTMKNIISLILHFLFVVAVFFSLNFINQIPSQYLPILKLVPFFLAFATLILAYRFNRSIVIFATLIFSLVYTYASFAPTAKFPLQASILNSLVIFVVINVAVISYYRERGIFTFLGLSRMMFIVLQAVALMWLIYQQHPLWQQYVQQDIFPAVKIQFLFFKQAALFAMLASAFLMVISFFSCINPFRKAIFIAMLFVVYSITLSPQEINYIAVLVSFALLLLLVTIISESYRMAFIDELTDLPGRRALNENLNKLGGKYVLAMLDVDHFKKFNDTYGHDAGDDVLQLLGAKLKTVTGGGKPFRYGGEEFTIVFSGANPEDVEFHLDQLRASVANKKFVLRSQERRHKNKRGKNKGSDNQVTVTISIGYAAPGSEAKTPAQVLKAADQALYRAKNNGRNCVSS